MSETLMKVYQQPDGTWLTANYDKKTGKLEIFTQEHVGYLLEGNKKLQEDPSNGFGRTREGTFGRLIGRPSDMTYMRWRKEFENMGGKQQSNWTQDWQKFLRKKLAEDQESRTVKKLRSVQPNEKNIIIK